MRGAEKKQMPVAALRAPAHFTAQTTPIGGRSRLSPGRDSARSNHRAYAMKSANQRVRADQLGDGPRWATPAPDERTDRVLRSHHESGLNRHAEIPICAFFLSPPLPLSSSF